MITYADLVFQGKGESRYSINSYCLPQILGESMILSEEIIHPTYFDVINR